MGGSCDSGTFIVGTNSAPADGSNGISLSQSKYQELCCDPPMKCASASNLEGEVSSDQPCAASLFLCRPSLRWWWPERPWSRFVCRFGAAVRAVHSPFTQGSHPDTDFES